MAGFDLTGMLIAVRTIVQNLPTVTTTQAAVYTGVPESFEARINAAVTLGPATPAISAFGLQERSPEITVLFGYKVGANEEGAELALCDLVDELIDAIEADPTLGGTSDEEVTIDTSGASLPEYRVIGGVENRLYPVVITGHQQRGVS